MVSNEIKPKTTMVKKVRIKQTARKSTGGKAPVKRLLNPKYLNIKSALAPKPSGESPVIHHAVNLNDRMNEGLAQIKKEALKRERETKAKCTNTNKNKRQKDEDKQPSGSRLPGPSQINVSSTSRESSMTPEPQPSTHATSMYQELEIEEIEEIEINDLHFRPPNQKCKEMNAQTTAPPSQLASANTETIVSSSHDTSNYRTFKQAMHENGLKLTTRALSLIKSDFGDLSDPGLIADWPEFVINWLNQRYIAAKPVDDRVFNKLIFRDKQTIKSIIKSEFVCRGIPSQFDTLWKYYHNMDTNEVTGRHQSMLS